MVIVGTPFTRRYSRSNSDNNDASPRPDPVAFPKLELSLGIIHIGFAFHLMVSRVMDIH